MINLRYNLQFLLIAIAMAMLTNGSIRAQPGTPADNRPYILSELNEQGIPSLLNGVTNYEDWRTKRERIRAAWLETIGEIPDRVPLRYQVISETEEPDYTRKTISYDTVYGDRVTAYLLVPKTSPPSPKGYPAVMALHPTGEAGKDIVALASGKKNRTYGYELVSRGYVVLAPDALTAGDRIYEEYDSFRSSPFYKKHPDWSMVSKNIVDHMQGVDLLVSLDEVNPEAIGAIGHSFGGYNAYFLSSIDSRIKAVVASCGVSPFTNSEVLGHWGQRDWYTHMPKITPALERGVVPFEFNEIIALSAPRPMFFYSAQSDHIFPHWKAVGEVILDVYSLYQWLDKEHRFVSVMGVGDHDFPPPVRERAYEFIDHWLKGRTDQSVQK